MDLRGSCAVSVFAASILTGCAAGPQIDPKLEEHRDLLLAVMRDAATKPVPKRPPLYTLSGNWVVGEFGWVVAIDGPMIAVRLRPNDVARLHGRRADAEYLHAIVPVAAPDPVLGRSIIGDGIVVAKIDDVLVCRWFASEFAGKPVVRLGDHASVEWETSATLREMVAEGTAEWFHGQP